MPWRLCKRRYRENAFDGEGARLYGSRWTIPGIPVVYASSTLSLAALELLVHMDPEDIIEDLIAFEVSIPGDLARQTIRRDALPKAWRHHPAAPRQLQDLGSQWARTSKTAVLVVPSAVVPIETNVILNPRHDDFRRIRIGASHPFALDPRLRRQ